MDDWHFFEPCPTRTYSINTFDDGNQEFQHYQNSWLVYGRWLGKVALVNAERPDIRIKSISAWKTNPTNPTNYHDIGSGKYSSNSPE